MKKEKWKLPNYIKENRLIEMLFLMATSIITVCSLNFKYTYEDVASRLFLSPEVVHSTWNKV